MDDKLRRTVLKGLGITVGGSLLSNVSLAYERGVNKDIITNDMYFIQLVMRAKTKNYQGTYTAVCTEWPSFQPLNNQIHNSQDIIISAYNPDSQDLLNSRMLVNSQERIETISEKRQLNNLPVIPSDNNFDIQLADIETPPVNLEINKEEVSFEFGSQSKKVKVDRPAQITHDSMDIDVQLKNHGLKRIIAHPSQTLIPKNETSTGALNIIKQNMNNSSNSNSIAGNSPTETIHITEYPNEQIYGISVTRGGK
ncbi:hypothetical protein [Haladaptatus sp. DYSN1]|uniref:hypothetical protein n=1 Tax=unclassified Haladaptatus TaxID=2622732 RepID=UPI00240624A0|nr:hypothetical protein [Haladaptatus sp. DYSN1]